jgi:hypothetical protein
MIDLVEILEKGTSAVPDRHMALMIGKPGQVDR